VPGRRIFATGAGGFVGDDLDGLAETAGRVPDTEPAVAETPCSPQNTMLRTAMHFTTSSQDSQSLKMDGMVTQSSC